MVGGFETIIMLCVHCSLKHIAVLCLGRECSREGLVCINFRMEGKGREEKREWGGESRGEGGERMRK